MSCDFDSSIAAFLRKPSVSKAGELLSLNRNQLRITTGLLIEDTYLNLRW